MVLAADSGVFAIFAGGVERMRVNSNGNVGIGTTSPGSMLEVASGSFISDNATTVGPVVSGDATGNPGHLGYRVVLNNTSGNFAGFLRGVRTSGTTFIGLEVGTETNHGIRFLTNGTGDSAERMRITPTGNVGIGTISPSHKLQVVGSVRATSFVADTNTYADFVFAPDYRLPSLSEVEAHIQAHGHLPGVPSEAEARRDGIDLAAMQVKLLQKIEELTLHIIRQEKELAALNAQLSPNRPISQ